MSEEPTPFDAWVAAAKPGERYDYYFGDLAFDRFDRDPNTEAKRAEARAAWEAHERGLVALTQYRHRPSTWTYWATRSDVTYWAPRQAK